MSSNHQEADVEVRYSPPHVGRGTPSYTPSVITRVSSRHTTTSRVSASNIIPNPSVVLVDCLSASQEDNTITVPSGQSHKKSKPEVVSSSSDSYSGSGSSSSGSSSSDSGSSPQRLDIKEKVPIKPLLTLEPVFKNLVDGMYDSGDNSEEIIGNTAGSPIIPVEKDILIHPDAIRLPRNLSASSNFTEEQRFHDYKIHSSIADKPYLGHSFPGFQKYIRTPQKGTSVQLLSIILLGIPG